MREISKYILTFVVATGLIIAPILCCCYMNEAWAHEVETAMPSCHAMMAPDEESSSQSSKADEGNDCDCPSIISTSSKSKSFSAVLTPLTFDQALAINNFVSYTENVKSSVDCDAGPPVELVHPTPIYLQNSNLQL